MSTEERMDEWLERWEDLAERGPRPSVEAFLATVAGPGDEGLASEFRRCAYALEQVAGVMAGSEPGLVGNDGGVRHPDGPADFGRYRTTRLHARGGLGEVYEATDTEMGRTVALKLIRGDRVPDSVGRRRFDAEAQLTGRLEHPGIVPVYGAGQDQNGRPFYAMRLIRGTTLGTAADAVHAADLARGRSDRLAQLRRLLGRFVQVCQAIGYAHGQGVLHRDIKPANVMLGEFGETLVVDWGLAKQLQGGPDLSGAGGLPMAKSSGSTLADAVVGTPSYMSPEQAGGADGTVGPASDVYGLGATLYSLLTGRPPYDGGSVSATLAAVRSGAFRSPREVNPWCPRDLDAICRTAMALDPTARYPTALALSEDVERWLADEPVSARPEPPLEKVRRWVKRHRTAASVVAAVVLVGTVAALVSTSLLGAAWSRERTARAAADARGTELEELNVRLRAEREEVERQRRAADRGRQAAMETVERLTPILSLPLLDRSYFMAVFNYIAGKLPEFPYKERSLAKVRDNPELAEEVFRLGAGFAADQAAKYLSAGDTLLEEGNPRGSILVYGRVIEQLTKLAPRAGAETAKVRAVLGAAQQSRAVTLESLGLCGEALKDWDDALRHVPAEDRPRLQLDRSLCLMRLGRSAEAVAAADADGWEGRRRSHGEAVKLARVFALDARSNPASKGLAIRWIEAAVTDGAKSAEQVAELLRTDPEFESVSVQAESLRGQR